MFDVVYLEPINDRGWILRGERIVKMEFDGGFKWDVTTDNKLMSSWNTAGQALSHAYALARDRTHL